MDLLTALSQTFDHTHRVIAGVRADQISNATPCTEWDVKALLGHALGVVAGFGGAVRGDAPPAGDAAFVLADDPAAQFRGLADATLAAWKKADLNSEINIGAGPMPGTAALSVNLLDTSTHAWDIARATGQPEDLPEELATLVFGICQGFVTNDIRKLAGFAPVVALADNASTTSKLVAFLGRKP